MSRERASAFVFTAVPRRLRRMVKMPRATPRTLIGVLKAIFTT